MRLKNFLTQKKSFLVFSSSFHSQEKLKKLHNVELATLTAKKLKKILGAIIWGELIPPNPPALGAEPLTTPVTQKTQRRYK